VFTQHPIATSLDVQDELADGAAVVVVVVAAVEPAVELAVVVVVVGAGDVDAVGAVVVVSIEQEAPEAPLFTQLTPVPLPLEGHGLAGFGASPGAQ